MKKSLIFAFGLFVALVGMMSCGNGAADEERQKAIKDSLYNDSIMKAQAAAEAALQDSLAAVALADSLRQVAIADSIAEAEAAKSGKPRPKKPATTTTTTPPPTTTPTPPALQGKDAIKGGGTTAPSGKDAIKGGGNTAPSGKDAIKGGGGF